MNSEDDMSRQSVVMTSMPLVTPVEIRWRRSSYRSAGEQIEKLPLVDGGGQLRGMITVGTTSSDQVPRCDQGC